MKIFDCTTYFDEDLLMDVRFNILGEKFMFKKPLTTLTLSGALMGICGIGIIFYDDFVNFDLNSGTTLDLTAPTVDINCSTSLTIDTDSVIFSSSELAKVFAPVSTFIPGTEFISEINSGILFPDLLDCFIVSS